MTHRSAVYALIVEQSFLQGDFLRSDLLSCHILSTGGGGQEVSQNISEMTGVHSVVRHVSQRHNKSNNCCSCLL